jgi:hypothetical protein
MVENIFLFWESSPRNAKSVLRIVDCPATMASALVVFQYDAGMVQLDLELSAKYPDIYV